MTKPNHTFVSLTTLLDDALKEYVINIPARNDIIKQVSQVLHDEYHVKEVWWFNPYDGDDVGEQVRNRLVSCFPVYDQETAEMLFMQGYELSQYRIMQCYCDEEDERMDEPVPRPYQHIDWVEWGHRIYDVLPDEMTEALKNVLVTNIRYYLMTVTPTVQVWRIAGLKVSDEKVAHLLMLRGFKVDSYTIKNCKSAD